MIDDKETFKAKLKQAMEKLAKQKERDYANYKNELLYRQSKGRFRKR